MLGGLIAVGANAALWPSREADRVRADLRAALAAHAAFAAAVLERHPGVAADRARRAAGLASNNLEVSLGRVMQEPGRGQRDRLEAVLVADATLRRIAGRLTAIALDPLPRGAGAEAAWVISALQALTDGDAVAPAPLPCGREMLDRLARQTALLPEIMQRVDRSEAAGTYSN